MASDGPKPISRAARLELAAEIAQHALASCGQCIKAIGLYGSIARGTDGPYSDIEMLCVLRSRGEDYTHEWTHGPWKAEANFVSEDVALAEAATVESTWPLTHGAYARTQALYDPEAFLPRLREAVHSPPDQAFREAIREAIVGELYEWIGKLRNARVSHHTPYVAELAVGMARYGAFIIGLAHRHLYTTGPRVLEEAMVLPDRPEGFDILARLVMEGRLSDTRQVDHACETFWRGVTEWAGERCIHVVESRRIPF